MRRPFLPLTARFVPSCETLESRLVPAVNIAEINGHILLIDGSLEAEQVAITDDGYGNVTVSAGVGGETLGTFDGINKINVRMRAGADTFEYVRGGVVTAAIVPGTPHKPMKLKVDLGWGADDASFDLSNGLDNEKVVIHVAGSLDNDSVQADIGSLNESKLLMLGKLGWGDDTFDANLTGDLTGEVLLGLDIAGGIGKDLIDVQASNVNVSADSILGLYLQGNLGDDSIDAGYTGSNSGGLGMLISAGGGKDTIHADFDFASGGVGGSAALGVWGGGGDDTMTMSIVNPGSIEEGIYVVHGGTGTDTAITTPEVISLSIETDGIPVPI